MLIRDPKVTAREAANIFVQEMFPGRVIGEWNPDPERATFKLVDGNGLYVVLMVSSGWKVYRQGE